MLEITKVKKIVSKPKETEVRIKGWVINSRGNKSITFLEVNDGSTFANLQVVIKNPDFAVAQIKKGFVVDLEGQVKLITSKKQSLEILLTKLTSVKSVDDNYPIQKSFITFDNLRQIPHLRHKTQIFQAIMKVRSTLALEIHDFFASKNFLLMTAPILTSNDGEGAGETFVVDGEGEQKGFFTKKTRLGVTGQLHGEAYANGFGDIYVFGPTFRAEKSHTKKHAAEFWMVEPEMAFYDLKKTIAFTQEFLQKVIKKTINKLPDEMAFLNQKSDDTLLKKLNLLIEEPFLVLTYSKAIKHLQEAEQFKGDNINFGMDLSTEHEHYLASKIARGAVFVVDYPKQVKAFYMKQNSDHKTVAAFDLLVPQIGELLGGSVRESDYEKLLKRIDELGLDKEQLQWYLNIRQFGGGESAGFGLGFERFVMLVTGVENIRDSIPFPRTPGNIQM